MNSDEGVCIRVYKDRVRCWKLYKDKERKLMKINGKDTKIDEKDMKMDESL